MIDVTAKERTQEKDRLHPGDGHSQPSVSSRE